MSAPKGNQFWKLRNKHGRSKRFASPEQLWEAACEYFAYCDRTPWKVIKNKTKGEIKEKEEKPYTTSLLSDRVNGLFRC